MGLYNNYYFFCKSIPLSGIFIHLNLYNIMKRTIKTIFLALCYSAVTNGQTSIIIGQAAEFDYSGTQACRALKAEGIETVLLNSNPATIMTDPDVADHVYIEPMTLEVVERILEIEKPDSVLPNLGGQMGLNLSMELARSGYLDRTGIRLLACKPETIDRAEDRELFKETMEKLHQPIIPSEVVETLQDALACADRIGYPVIVRPFEIEKRHSAFSLDN